MARIIVIGSGFGGLGAAIRWRHAVTEVEISKARQARGACLCSRDHGFNSMAGQP